MKRLICIFLSIAMLMIMCSCGADDVTDQVVNVLQSENELSTESYIKEFYRENFGNESGIVFLIDMDNRYIYLFSDGDIYDVVTKRYAEIITDNIYQYASDGEYYVCAYKAFEQVLDLLEGKDIS